MSILSIIFGLGLFLSAYIVGKHQGYKRGLREGKSSMILELREQSLIEGGCFFCKKNKSNEWNREHE